MTGRVGLPALRVQVGYDASVADLKAGVAAVWSDVTGWLRVGDGVSWNKGRSSESDTAASAGRLQATFNTATAAGALLDPDAKMDLRTPIRVQWQGAPLWFDSDVDYDADVAYDDDDESLATAVTLWTGLVDDYVGGWTGGVRPYRTLTASDLVARLSTQLLQTLPVQTVLTTGGCGWLFPLDEDAGAMSAACRAGSAGRLTRQLVGSGSTLADFGQGYSPGSQAAGAETTALGLQPTDTSNYHFFGGPVPELDWVGWSVHLMVAPNTVAAATIVAATHPDGSTLAIGVTAAGKATATVTGPSSGGAITVTGTTTLTAAGWTHIAVTCESDYSAATVRIYTNGALEDTQTGAAKPSPPTTLNLGFGGTYAGNIAGVAGHNTRLTTAQVARIAAGRGGWDNEPTTNRFARVATAAGWTRYTIGTGSTNVGPQPTKGESVADALSAVAASEVAPWWVAGDGTLRMEGRDYRYTATPAFTIPAEAIANATEITRSDVGMINIVNASRPGGSQATRTAAASVDRYGDYPTDLQLLVRSDADLDAIAAGLVNMHATPQPRSDTIEVDLVVCQSSISDLAACVAADVGTMFTVTGLPTDHGTPADVSFFVEGVADAVTTSGWKRTFNVSPAAYYDVGILDDPIKGVLGVTTRLGF